MTVRNPVQPVDDRVVTMSDNGDVAGNRRVIEQGMQAVEDVLFDATRSDVDVLHEASHHILQAGGKRIRPRLLLLSYLAAGGARLEETTRVAAAVELVHTASIVHDDINDHGVLRRGRASVNARWGRTFALLTGDFLFTKVYELMAPYRDLNIILAEATSALVEGETLQASAVKNGEFSREVYYQIIARKTAALFRSAAVLGASLANAPEKQIEALGNYGFSIGLAFQIIDDILDFVADSEQLGKTVGLDAQQGKGLAAVHGNGQANGAELPDAGDPMHTIKQKIMQGDAIPQARRKAHDLLAAAVVSLQTLPPSPSKSMLVELAHVAVERDR